MKRPRIAFLISGRGSNMQAILKKIKQGKLKADVALVFSNKKLAGGLKLAQEYNIETLAFSPKDFESNVASDDTEKNLSGDFRYRDAAYNKKLSEELINRNVDFVICAGYMKILKEPILSTFKNKIINIHPALLPAFVGLHVQKQALDYGAKVSGLTIHLVDEGVDTGPILQQVCVPIKKNDNEDSLAKRILKQEHKHYWRVLRKLFKGYTVEGRQVIFTED